MQVKKILILGVTGMLGHTLYSQLSGERDMEVYATARSSSGLNRWFPKNLLTRILSNVDADNFDSIIRAIAQIKPDVVINCIGIIKQLPAAKDHLTAIKLNALLPHRIALACSASGAKLVHISTDCVFDGVKGNYTEEDLSDATDLYGKTKYLGELTQLAHCVTLRTSIIGHELKGKLGLVEWFLAQDGKVRGYTGAIYSGFPTIELSHIITAYIIPNQALKGLFHVSSEPITKFDLLKLIAEKYQKRIEIEPESQFCSNRALDATLFREITGYRPPTWPELVDKMHHHYITAPYYEQPWGVN